MPADGETRAATVGKWLLAVVVLVSALAIGSLHAPWLMLMTLLAAASAVLLWRDPPRRITRSTRLVLLVLVCLVAVTALQAVPLPARFVAAIAPSNADIWQRAMIPFREPGPSWHPISVAPPATHLEILRGVLYGAVGLASVRVALLRGGRRFLEGVVVGSCAIIAVVTLAHTAVHAERVFGVYAPREAQGFLAGRIGPILNPNHFAAYCNVGAMVATAAAFRERALVPRALGGAAALLLAGTSVWAASRGGTGSLLLGLVLVVGLSLLKRRRRSTSSRIESVLVGSAALTAAVLVGLGCSEIARADLAGRDMSKLEIVRAAFGLVSLSPIFGFGRGSFETMFPLVRDGTTYSTFLRPENLVAQWTIEWGVPIAIVAFAALLVALRPRAMLAAERPPIGAWVAVALSVLHDLVDFHLEIPAIAVVVTVCVGIVVARGREGDREGFVRASFPRALSVAFAGAAVAATAIAVPNVGHTLSEDREAIANSAIEHSHASADFRAELRAATLRYPAEPYFPLAGAVHAQVRREGSVISWIARALERYPNFGRAHLVLARDLASRHRAQARLEYRLAYANDIYIRSLVLRETPYLVDDLRSALEIAGDGPSANEVIESLAVRISERLPATAAQLDAELLARKPDATGPIRRRIAATLSDIEHDHPWCRDRAPCIAQGEAAAEELIRREPDKCEPHVLLARVRIKGGRIAEALDALERAIDVTNERTACIRAFVTLSQEAGDRRRVDAALDRASRYGCATREECADFYAWAAGIEQRRGNHVRAIGFFKRVSDLRPESDEDLERVAQAAEEAGLDAEALEAYRKLSQRHPEDPRWRARAEGARAKAMSRHAPSLPSSSFP